MQQAFTGFVFQNYFLLFESIYEITLAGFAFGKLFIKRSVVIVPASLELFYQRLVTEVQRPRLAYPAQCLRMAGVPAPKISSGSGRPAASFVLGQNIPKAMELAMLAKEMLSA